MWLNGRFLKASMKRELFNNDCGCVYNMYIWKLLLEVIKPPKLAKKYAKTLKKLKKLSFVSSF